MTTTTDHYFKVVGAILVGPWLRFRRLVMNSEGKEEEEKEEE